MDFGIFYEIQANSPLKHREREAEVFHQVLMPGTVRGVYASHTIQIDSLYSRAALRHRISSRSCAGTSAKLFSIMRADSG
jgi:hypothetical protein